MSIGMGKSAATAALAMMCTLFGADATAGGELTASFTATPSSLEEGQSSELRLSLQYVPAPMGSGQGTRYDGDHRYDYFNSGVGELTSLVGSVDPGQGESIDVSSPIETLSHEVVESVVYDDSGVYSASVSGTATAYDQRSAERYKRHPVYYYWMTNGFIEDYEKLTHVLPIDASVEIGVSNANPSITNISWSPAAPVGLPFSFSVTASDPGGVSPDETMTIAFDLDDDGEFDDFVSDGLVASGTHTFFEQGTHVIHVRVTDGLGGSTEGSFSVVVGNHAPSVAPLQSAVVEYVGVSPELELFSEVGDDDGHPMTATWLVQNAAGEWQARKTEENVLSGAVLKFRDAYRYGSTNVRLEVSDGYDLTVVSTTVTVRDTDNPIVGSSEDVRIPTDPGKAVATGVTLPPPSVQDRSGRPVELTNDAPSTFRLGETVVVWTATDASGNRSTVLQKVIVEDREAPTLQGRRIVRIFPNPGKLFGTTELLAPAAFDNVSDPSKIAMDGGSRTRFRIGRTLVVFRGTDEAGNFAEWRTVVVVVNRRPIARAGADVVVTTTSEEGARVKLDGRRSSDPDRHRLKFEWRSAKAKLAPATAARTAGLFPVGMTRVRLIVTDAAGARRTDVVKVTVKLENSKYRPRGKAANDAFAGATRSTERAVAAGVGGEKALSALIYANTSAGLGDAAGEYVRWDQAGEETDSEYAYAELRLLQQRYGQVAANALLEAYAETGDESLLSAYGDAVRGVAQAQADLNE